MGMAVGAGAAVGAGLVAKGAIDFQSAMKESLAIMNVTVEQEKEMEAAARKVGTTTAISATQAAQSFFFLASAGLDANQAIAAMPSVANFAQAGMFNMERATELLMDTQSSLGMRSADAAENLLNMKHVADVITKANIVASGSVEQFAEALQNRAGAQAKSLGMTIEETTAILMAMSDQGIKGARAGMELTIFLRDLQMAAVKNAGAWIKMGITVFDAQGEMLPIPDILEQMEKKMGSMSDAEKTAAFEMLGLTATAQGIGTQLIGASAKVREYQKTLDSAGGATDEIAGKQMESMNMQLELLKNKFLDVSIEMGKTFMPVIQQVVGWLGSLLDLIVKYSGPISVVIGYFMKFAAVVAGVWAVAAGISAVMGALSALFSPIGLVIVGIMALWAAWEAAMASPAAENIKRALVDIWELVKEVVMNIIDGFTQVWGLLSAIFGESTKGMIGSVFETILTWVRSVLDWFSLMTTNWVLTWEYMKAYVESVWIGIKSVVADAWNYMIALAAGGIGGIIGGMGALVDYFVSAFTEIGNLFSAMWEGIKAAWAAGFDGDPMAAFTDAFSQALAAQKDAAIPDFMTAVKDGAANAFDTAMMSSAEGRGQRAREAADVAGRMRALKKEMAAERDLKRQAAQEAVADAAGAGSSATTPLTMAEAAVLKKGAGGIGMGGAEMKTKFVGIEELGKGIQEGISGSKKDAREQKNAANLGKIAANGEKLNQKIDKLAKPGLK